MTASARVVGGFGAAGLLAIALLRAPPGHPVLGRLPAAWQQAPLLAFGVLAGLGALHLVPAVRRRLSAMWDTVLGGGGKGFGWGLFLGTTGLCVLVSWLHFDGMPAAADAVAYRFQALIFLEGRLVAPSPPPWQSFEMHGILDARTGLDTWCSMYQPGWPAVLALGLAVGIPWGVNPLLTGAAAVATWRAGAEWFGDEAVGRIAGLLLATSPMLLEFGGTWLPNPLTLLCGVIAFWMVHRLLERGGWGYGLAAGIAVGWALLSRPMTGMAIGVALAGLPLIRWRVALVRWRGCAAALAAVAVCVGLLLVYQRAQTGDALTPGHFLAGGGDTFTLGLRGGDWTIPREQPGHRNTAAGFMPGMSVNDILWRFHHLNRRYLAWPLPAFLLFLFPVWTGRFRARDALLILPLVVFPAGFFSFYYYEYWFPARYYSETVPFLCMLAGWGLAGLSGRWRPAVLSCGFGWALAVALPLALRPVPHDVSPPGYFRDLERRYDIENAVVFVERAWAQFDRTTERYGEIYNQAFLENRPVLAEQDVVYARYSDVYGASVIAHFPERAYYRLVFFPDDGRHEMYRVHLEPRLEFERLEPGSG